MDEPLSNIGVVCDEHAPKPDPRYRELAIEWFLDRRAFVKLGFDSCEEARQALGERCPPKEHMWVEVLERAEREGEELRGMVSNDPKFTDFACGELFEFSRTEVEDAIAGAWKKGEAAWTPVRGAWQPCVLDEDTSGPAVKVRSWPQVGSVLPGVCPCGGGTRVVDSTELRPRFGSGAPPPRPPRMCGGSGDLYGDDRRTT